MQSEAAVADRLRSILLQEIHIGDGEISQADMLSLLITAAEMLEKRHSISEQAERGDYVARKVWSWLNTTKAIGYVPWVLDPDSPQYDPKKAHEQEVRDALLAELEEVIAAASTASVLG
jgi:hypothetical protein